jgi:hypothetical protein
MNVAFGLLLKYIVPLLSALPQLIQGLEAMWKGTKSAGATKWIAVETALSSSIELVANEVAAAVPATNAGHVSNAVAIFTKKVNDAFVELANTLGIFQHG